MVSRILFVFTSAEKTLTGGQTVSSDIHPPRPYSRIYSGFLALRGRTPLLHTSSQIRDRFCIPPENLPR